MIEKSYWCKTSGVGNYISKAFQRYTICPYRTPKQEIQPFEVYYMEKAECWVGVVLCHKQCKGTV